MPRPRGLDASPEPIHSEVTYLARRRVIGALDRPHAHRLNLATSSLFHPSRTRRRSRAAAVWVRCARVHSGMTAFRAGNSPAPAGYDGRLLRAAIHWPPGSSAAICQASTAAIVALQRGSRKVRLLTRRLPAAAGGTFRLATPPAPLLPALLSTPDPTRQLGLLVLVLVAGGRGAGYEDLSDLGHPVLVLARLEVVLVPGHLPCPCEEAPSRGGSNGNGESRSQDCSSGATDVPPQTRRPWTLRQLRPASARTSNLKTSKARVASEEQQGMGISGLARAGPRRCGCQRGGLSDWTAPLLPAATPPSPLLPFPLPSPRHGGLSPEAALEVPTLSPSAPAALLAAGTTPTPVRVAHAAPQATCPRATVRAAEAEKYYTPTSLLGGRYGTSRAHSITEQSPRIQRQIEEQGKLLCKRGGATPSLCGTHFTQPVGCPLLSKLR
ncbi:hypothetical protein PAPYR_7485 [Paratrimastix pyriformis]|uniref:Uncharacterized protein n=1 Tax=Paratrimastix pyriformis TaxID=342808 RepID=A0ABQ8UD50_9EUKA|nr:hypothetical protein PAPYR_7485 [Paratrimastix pyriformis]